MSVIQITKSEAGSYLDQGPIVDVEGGEINQVAPGAEAEVALSGIALNVVTLLPERAARRWGSVALSGQEIRPVRDFSLVS
jgi:hypothetical protein